MKIVDMDEIYRNMAPEKIPWICTEPPKILVELVETGVIQPCRTVDFGCGIGNSSIYLAGKGFDVTGVDFSPTAIGIARENANKRGIECNFIAADVLGNLDDVVGTFDFAYDWELLHHIYPEQRETYIKNLRRKLNPNGRYLSLCFSEKSPQFGGKGKYRKTPLGTCLYFSSENELKELFTPYFYISELKVIEISGKNGSHLAVYAFMRAKG
jgi:SAM-dependent methyltransferase